MLKIQLYMECENTAPSLNMYGEIHLYMAGELTVTITMQAFFKSYAYKLVVALPKIPSA